MSKVIEVVIKEDLTKLLASDQSALQKRFHDGARQHFGDEALGDGVVRLVIRDLLR